MTAMEKIKASDWAKLQAEAKAGRSRYKRSPKSERTMDKIVFASKAEMNRYGSLRLGERAGMVRDLKMQPSWKLTINGVDLGRYTADFSYLDRDGNLVVEDVKSTGTAKERDYKLRVKLLEALHGIRVREVLGR
jgi:hypothetical protein